MKSIYKAMSMLFILTIVGSCDFGETNIDPTAVSADKVTLELILPKAEIQSAYNLAATSSRIAGIWMQYFEGVEAQQSAISNYNVTESDVNNTWEFQLYVGSLRDNITLLEKAQVEGSEAPHYEGIAKILMAQNLGYATQLWGDIPYTEAFLGSENLKPAYDTQESIFGTVQRLLDEGITALSGSDNGRPVGGDDLIYAGSASSWVATARALKARYHLMLSKRDGNSAYNNALADINAGAITTLADQPDFFFGEEVNDANPMALFESDRSSTLQVDPTFAETILAGDPRASVYYLDDILYRFADESLFWGRNESPLPLISYSEIKFIEAEASLMTGNLIGAQAALSEAILANMSQVGLDATSASVTAYAAANSNLAAITGQSNQLDKVIEEKYKSMYVQGMVEIWSDFRRTGFPSLLSPEPGANLSIIPRRLPYPQSERLTNVASLNAAISNQGGASLSDDLWVFN